MNFNFLGFLVSLEKCAFASGSFSVEPIIHRRRSMKEVPARSAISDAMSKDLIQRGFKFVGTTICYAKMQAIGMVNDHLVTCFRHKELTKLHKENTKP